ncbi:50S ribosomal protein L17 [Patescibacteria group bacterium]|nr:50S ribosomal protein L17 [Patescibacteria group bacterium]MBU1721606.1 50S ribosomal protein L17 [Patescibacteria group bacterium]MBU1901732.1 50S ribosomal protein L17 [Patescibacteria group bacterium]
MRHNKKKATLGREAAPRKALFRNLAESLVLHGGIQTTRAKAKALRGVIEPLVTKAKRGTLADRRAIAEVLYTQDAARLMMELGKKYIDRPGGYTRIVSVGDRPQDGADMVRIEFVS